MKQQKNKNSTIKYSTVMKKYLFILLMVFCAMSLTAQTITFEYDAAGNRVKRYSSCPDQTIDLGPDVSICSGQNHTIYATPGFVSYTWNGIEGSNTLDILTGGNYQLEAIDADGCTYTGEVYVSENPIPAVNIVTEQQTNPADDFVYLEPDTEYQSYQWTGNQTCRILCVPMEDITSEEVNIELIVTNEFGCEGSSTILLVKDISAPAFKDAITENVIENKPDSDIDEVVYTIYPNPTEDWFYFEASNPDKVNKVELYSINGDLIQSFVDINQVPLIVDMSGHPEGLYLLWVCEENSIKQFKIVHK